MEVDAATNVEGKSKAMAAKPAKKTKLADGAEVRKVPVPSHR